MPTYKYNKQYGKFNEVKPNEGTSLLIKQILNSMIKIADDYNLTPLEVVSLLDSQIHGSYERSDELVKIYVKFEGRHKEFAQGVGGYRFTIATIMDMVLRSNTTMLGFIGKIGLIRRQLFTSDVPTIDVAEVIKETEVEKPMVKKPEVKKQQPKVKKQTPKVVKQSPKAKSDVETNPAPKMETIEDDDNKGKDGNVVTTNPLLDDFM